jgi:methylated-DNA-[protein]-cysteine S-methyltransferase
LNGYFSGKNVRFDIPLDWSDFSEFQKSVWRATAKIPYGQTKTYSWVARAAGSPAATRAAGSALGVNPLPVIIPCHRVVRADGALGGFGMGLPMKEKLLKLESK